MVRNYKRKTDRGQIPKDTILLAISEVNTKKRSVRSVSEEFGIPRKTLGRYCKKYEGTLAKDLDVPARVGLPTPSEVTTDAPTTVRTALEVIPTADESTEVSEEVNSADNPTRSASQPTTEVLMPVGTSMSPVDPLTSGVKGPALSFGYAKRFQVGVSNSLLISDSLYYNNAVGPTIIVLEIYNLCIGNL